MGLNTAMIVRNDFLHRIADDPDFGKKVRDAIYYAHHPEAAPYHGQSFDVLPSSHADYNQAVIIGGNTIRKLGRFAGTYDDKDADVLHHVAESMGYWLVKKRSIA